MALREFRAHQPSHGCVNDDKAKLILEHLAKDDESRKSLDSFRALAERKYGRSRVEGSHDPAISEFKQLYKALEKGQVRSSWCQKFLLHHPRVSECLKRWLVSARDRLVDKRWSSVISQVLTKRGLESKRLAFCSWRALTTASKACEKSARRKTLRAWACYALNVRWRRRVGVRILRTMLERYRFRRLFDSWRIVTWLASYVSANFMRASSNCRVPGHVPTATRLKEIENRAELAFRERFHRSGCSGLPVSTQTNRILSESIRFVWNIVFSQAGLASDIHGLESDYTLLWQDGILRFRGRLSKAEIEHEETKRMRFIELIPPVWGGWRSYVQRSKEMRKVTALGNKFFLTRTRLRILSECVMRWWESQRTAFAQTTHSIRLKQSALGIWRSRLARKLEKGDSILTARIQYASTAKRRIFSYWKEAMRRRVLLEALGTMQTILHRRQMLLVIYTWRSHYFSVRLEEAQMTIDRKKQFKREQIDNEGSNVLLVCADRGANMCGVAMPEVSGQTSEFLMSLEGAQVNALQIQAFSAWRRLAQNSGRFRVFVNHHVDMCGRKLALRAFCVWRARGNISWESLTKNENTRAASSEGDRTIIGGISLIELIDSYQRRGGAAVAHHGSRAGETAENTGSVSHRGGETPLSLALGGSQSPASSHLLAGTSSSLNYQTPSAGHCYSAFPLFEPFPWTSARLVVAQLLGIMFPQDVPISGSPSSPFTRSHRSTPSSPQLDLDQYGSVGRRLPVPPNAHVRQEFPSRPRLPPIGVACTNFIAFGFIPGLTSGKSVRPSDLFPPLDPRFIAHLGLIEGSGFESGTLGGAHPRERNRPRVGVSGGSLGASSSQRNFHGVSPSAPAFRASNDVVSTALSAVHAMLQGCGENGAVCDLLLVKSRLLAAQQKASVQLARTSFNAADVLHPDANLPMISLISRKMYAEELSASATAPAQEQTDGSAIANRGALHDPPSVKNEEITLSPTSSPLNSPSQANARIRSVTITEAPKSRLQVATPRSDGISDQRLRTPRALSLANQISTPFQSTSEVNLPKEFCEYTDPRLCQSEQDSRLARRRSETTSLFSSAKTKIGKGDDQVAAECRRARRGVFSRFVQQRIGHAFVCMGIAIQAGRRRSHTTLVYGNRQRSAPLVSRPWWGTLGFRFFEQASTELSRADRAPQLESPHLGDHDSSRVLLSAYSTSAYIEAGLINAILDEQGLRLEQRRAQREWLFGRGYLATLTPNQAGRAASQYFVGQAPQMMLSLGSSLRSHLLENSRFEALADGRKLSIFLSHHPQYKSLLGPENERYGQQGEEELTQASSKSVQRMFFDQLVQGHFDCRTSISNAALCPILEYIDRNYKSLLKSPNTLHAFEAEQQTWAKKQLQAMRSLGSIPENSGSARNLNDLVPVTHDLYGSHSHFYRAAASGLMISELAQLLQVVGLTSEESHQSSPNISHSAKPDSQEVLGHNAVSTFIETLNLVIKHNRMLTIRRRMRTSFLLQRYKVASAAARFIQSLVLGGNGSVSSTALVAAPPIQSSAGDRRGSDHRQPHYTPFDKLTGCDPTVINPQKSAWSMGSPQFRRKQHTEYLHYTIRTAQQAEHQRIERDRQYNILLGQAHRLAKEEARISNATGSLAARLRAKGKKSRVGGNSIKDHDIPFLNSLVERARPGLASSELIVSPRLVRGNENSDDDKSDNDEDASQFTIIAPTLPKGKTRRLITLKKGAAQGLDLPPENLEDLKKTNPRLYYHHLYAMRNPKNSQVQHREHLMDLFKDNRRGQRKGLTSIGLIGQHAALELAIKWRLRGMERLYLKKIESIKKGASVPSVRSAEDEPDLYPFNAARIRFMFLL